jgi:hypothetical protein
MGRREKHVHDKLLHSTDKRLLDLMRYGRPAFDGNGHPVLDDQGNHIRTPPTASDMANAIKRLRDVGLTKADSERSQMSVIERIRYEHGAKDDDEDGPIAGRIEKEA